MRELCCRAQKGIVVKSMGVGVKQDVLPLTG